MSTPLPESAIDAEAPTSRSTFRLLARCIGATNRDADTLRLALLKQWSDFDGTRELVRRLRALDTEDPDGALGAESRLAVWFSLSESDDGRLVAESDPLVAELTDDLRGRLHDIVPSER